MSFFSVLLTGQIESCRYPTTGNLYCKYILTFGPDWSVVAGQDEGITQMALTSVTPDGERQCAWNFPIEVTLKSTNPFGWPQLIVCIYGTDILGRDVIRGYGCIRIPQTIGSHNIYCPLFAPMASLPINELLSTLSGKLPEFLDPKFVAGHDSRDVTRVRSNGRLKLNLHVGTKELHRLGYSVANAKS
ncbi:B9 domain-containing protein [Phlyctochytrium arcticum]|nr:B9 domain-containing protein [Phlyctochytrium arcticum]